MIKDQLLQLAEITDAVFQSAQTVLAKEVLREKELRAVLKALVADQSNRAEQIMAEPDAALIAGADVQWRAWVEQRRRLINAELAKCLVAQARHREAAAKAFGRHQAVLSLEEIRAKEVKLDAVRRAYYTS